MYILSVDTTAKTASVCVAKDDAVTGICPVSRLTLDSTVTHSETLLPMIDSALTLAGVSLSDMDAMAITAGPGSFTGVRIGVSTIKGLAFSLGDKIPCIPLSTLYCLSLNVAGYGTGAILCPLMDARREQFYNAIFRAGKVGASPKRLCDDRVITARELTDELCQKYSGKRIILCGDGARLYFSLMKKYPESESLKISVACPDDITQNAFSVAYAGWEKMNEKGFTPDKYTGSALSPIYLRLSQAERERNEKLKKENSI